MSNDEQLLRLIVTAALSTRPGTVERLAERLRWAGLTVGTTADVAEPLHPPFVLNIAVGRTQVELLARGNTVLVASRETAGERTRRIMRALGHRDVVARLYRYEP